MSRDVIKALIAASKQSVSKMSYKSALANKHLSVKDKIDILSLNQDNRLAVIKALQKHTLENLFKANPQDFYTQKFHFDWWVFPMTVPVEWNWPQRNYLASVNQDEAKVLLVDKEYVDTYIECITMYMDALDTHGWDNYPVRFARMLHSLSLFTCAASYLEEDPESVAVRLQMLCERARTYANREVLPLYSNYDLLNSGYDGLVNTLLNLERLEVESVIFESLLYQTVCEV